MRIPQWRLGALALALAATACAAPPVATSPSTSEQAKRYSVTQFGGQRQIEVVRAFSNNFLSYGGRDFRPFRAIDGNLDTEWASTNRRRAWLALSFDRPTRVDGIRIKTGPSGRSYYVVQFSNDGEDWYDGSGRLRNDSWQMEDKPVDGRGRYMRLVWFRNDDPNVDHFSVFEVEPYRGYGGGGGWHGDDGYSRPGRGW